MPKPRPPVSPARRIVLVLLLPLALAMLGAWQVRRAADDTVSLTQEADGLASQAARMEAVAAATPLRIVHFQGDPMGYSAVLAVQMMRDGVTVLRHGVTMARLREGLAAAVIAGGGTALLAGLVGLMTAAWAARRSRASRAALEAAFTRIRTLLPILLGAQIAGLTLACGTALLFEVAGAWYIPVANRIEAQGIAVGVAIAGFVLWLGWLTLRELGRSLAAFTPAPLPLFGRSVTEAEAPGLWRVITAEAIGQAATTPDHVVVGLVEGFFITSGTVALRPEGLLLEGHTLHVPLPALAVLNAEETAAIIGHELAHLAGEDTAYSQRFLPIYGGITRNLEAMGAVNGSSGVRWTQAPAFTLGMHMLEVFDGAVNHWRRQREIEADAVGVAAGGAEAAASALLRTELVGAVVHEALMETWEHPHAAPPNLVEAIVARIAATGLGDPSTLLVPDQPDAGDSHPPTLQRIAALGLAPDAALLLRAARLPLPVDAETARDLFADWDGLCGAASSDAVGFATEAGNERADLLLRTAAEGPETEMQIFQDVKRPVIAWTMAGLICLAAFPALTYRLAARPLEDPSAMPVLVLVAASLLGIGTASMLRAFQLHRSARTPFLTLHAAGFACRGLDRMVPWTAVDRIDMTAIRSIYLFFYLTPFTPLPKRVSGWSVQVKRRRRIVMLLGIQPRGLTAVPYLELVRRYWYAARAREALTMLEHGPAASPAAYSAILSEEQLHTALSDEQRT